MFQLAVYAVCWGWQPTKNCLFNCFSSMGPRNTSPLGTRATRSRGGGVACARRLGQGCREHWAGHACLTGLAACGHRETVGQDRPHKLEEECKSGIHQRLRPWRDLYQSPAPLADALKLVNGFPSHMVYALFNGLLLHCIPG